MATTIKQTSGYQDETTTIGELKKIVENFSKERDWDQYHAGKELAIGIITEASEFLEHFRFISVEESEKNLMHNELLRQELADELSDVLFFILRFAQKYNFDLASSFEKKMLKNREKYPVEKARGSNRKYNQL